ncbi:TetR/AcrR family transcriptional regulator [Actinomadura sp. 6K520]|jgi:AcrR family transcriptional regulator|uniref:TetR/AcrR family transcriptional regulator n=1 Tax=Actinomadura sp. 6K520 TaxID=2530364 RepID=UPI00104BEE0C|nr:TetR/AcrR family transcriptional regulator [Actinomadura sp. 6K520]TDE32951.1 TetR/AcrR family transcriptional regulator [Actinomadura sp. 6K520]
MPPPTRTPRERWVAAGLEALAEGGPESVRVEALAARLGVTKGGFYGHFPNRAALLTEMLDQWERRTTADVIAQVEAEGGDATAKMQRAGLRTFSSELLPIDLAIRSWARHDPDVAARLKRVDNARMGYLRDLFATYVDDPDEIDARSTLAFTLAIGRHFMAADHGGRTEHEAVSLASEYILRPPRP